MAQLEAFTGETMGWVSSCETNSEVPIQFEDEKATSARWNGLAMRSLAQSETPRTWRSPLYGTWEASSVSGLAYRTGS